MHDVVVGIYKPTAPAEDAGITLDSTGAVFDRFMLTVSIINGGNECAMDSSSLGPTMLQASKNRFIWCALTRLMSSAQVPQLALPVFSSQGWHRPGAVAGLP
jgi:hypothetical protein